MWAYVEYGVYYRLFPIWNKNVQCGTVYYFSTNGGKNAMEVRDVWLGCRQLVWNMFYWGRISIRTEQTVSLVTGTIYAKWPNVFPKDSEVVTIWWYGMQFPTLVLWKWRQSRVKWIKGGTVGYWGVHIYRLRLIRRAKIGRLWMMGLRCIARRTRKCGLRNVRSLYWTGLPSPHTSKLLEMSGNDGKSGPEVWEALSKCSEDGRSSHRCMVGNWLPSH